MRNLITFLVLTLIATETRAQVEYDTCQNIHRFEGEWRYTNGSDTIRVYLRVHREFYG
jgi:hypothetical protein